MQLMAPRMLTPGNKRVQLTTARYISSPIQGRLCKFLRKDKLSWIRRWAHHFYPEPKLQSKQ